MQISHSHTYTVFSITIKKCVKSSFHLLYNFSIRAYSIYHYSVLNHTGKLINTAASLVVNSLAGQEGSVINHPCFPLSSVQGALLGYISYFHALSHAARPSSSRPLSSSCYCHNPQCPLLNVVVTSPCCFSNHLSRVSQRSIQFPILQYLPHNFFPHSVQLRLSYANPKHPQPSHFHLSLLSFGDGNGFHKCFLIYQDQITLPELLPTISN